MSGHLGSVVVDVATINAVVGRLDANDADRDYGVVGSLAFRVLKISEEAGEAASALIGMVGQNPRKGVTHSRADVAGELCDVVLTAIVALASVEPDTWADTLADHLHRITARTINIPPARV